MADEKTFTQADLDKIKKDADERIEAMDAKVKEALDEAKKAKAALRSASEIKPEDFAAVEAERDKALADKAEAEKQVKTLTAERDKAVKALETESGFTTRLLTENALNASLSEAGVKEPAMLKATKAMFAGLASVAVENNDRVVKIGDKTLADHIKEWAATDEAKHFISAAHNSGSGANGGGTGDKGKTVTRQQFDAMSHPERSAFAKEGGKVVDAAA